MIKIKIGIISDRLNRQRTGIGNYVYNLLDQFDKESLEDIVLINYQKNSHFKNLEQILIKNPLDPLGNKSFYFWHIYLHAVLKAKDYGLDIIHSPENATPFTALKPNKVITVHDITPHFFPESFSPLTLLRYRLLFSRAMETSDRIIVDSISTKNDLIKYYKVKQEKIRVIYLGVNNAFKCFEETKVEEIKDKWRIDFPFILYVGTIEPRKNIYRLLMAFSKIKKKNAKYKLLMMGIKGWKFKNLLETINNLNLQKDIIFTGYVTDHELPLLYNAADLFIYPSLYEGFGLPPLEAMACGCPVVTSNTSSLPEVIGDAGIMVDPLSVDELANATYSILTNENLREELIKKGLQRSKAFSWKICSEKTLKVYKEIYNGD